MLLEWTIADFADAFFIMPLNPEERRYFVACYGGRYYVFNRTTQGSRGAPLTWARLAAQICRLTQGALGPKARLCCYVDDPLITMVAEPFERRQMQAMVLLLWSSLRLPLSLKKATAGQKVTWTSGQFSLLTTPEWGVEVRVKESIVTDVAEQTATLLKDNVVSLKVLASFTGKVMHICSLIAAMRPFITDLYAALHHSGKSKAPPGCTWTAQIAHVLRWIQVFLSECHGPLARRYWVSAFQQSASRVEITLDASPWGLGGYFALDGEIKAWLACPLCDEELAILQITRGDCKAQQCVEALAALVALRLWAPWWHNKRLSIRIRTDSVAALVLATRLTTRGTGCGIVAREVALDIASSTYEPLVGEHIPGIANVTCDALSRRYQPSTTFALPSHLLSVCESHPPKRSRSYFRTLSPSSPTTLS